jgi:hypothetical protein
MSERSTTAASSQLSIVSLGVLLALACTYRTDLIANGASGDGGEARAGGSAAGGAGGSGGVASTGTPSATNGAPPANDRSCGNDDDCVQCVYIAAPSDPGQCNSGLGCCGGQVMNKLACAINQAAWQANCAGRGFTAPTCPCIICRGATLPTCQNGECGFWICL